MNHLVQKKQTLTKCYTNTWGQKVGGHRHTGLATTEIGGDLMTSSADFLLERIMVKMLIGASVYRSVTGWSGWLIPNNTTPIQTLLFKS